MARLLVPPSCRLNGAHVACQGHLDKNLARKLASKEIQYGTIALLEAFDRLDRAEFPVFRACLSRLASHSVCPAIGCSIAASNNEAHCGLHQ